MLTDRSRKAVTLCSTLAIATALVVGSGAARAQSLQGSSNVVAGSANVTTGPGTTTVDVTSPSAVIDWTPFDTAINNFAGIGFQAANTTATFQSVSNFAVLNRIIPVDPTRPIQFDGNVISRIQGASPVPGGTVFFYSPGGIIVGSTAVFDVGNLGLTSAAPVFDTNGNFIDANGRVSFSQAAIAGSFVHLRTGSSITASPAGSFVAVVAPRVLFDGNINVNGSAALVAADAVDITFRTSGLFDIQVTSGSSSTANGGQVLGTTGTITGPAGSGLANSHRAYLVAVPKNTAITMAIGQGSSLGFNIAGAADIDGNAVVLSSGFDVVNGAIAATPSAGGGTGQAAVTIGAINATSALTAQATGQANIAVGGGQTGTFASDVSIAGTQSSPDPLFNAAQVNSSGTGAHLNIAGNLTVKALDPTVVAPASGYQVTRFAIVDATNGGNMSIGGSVTVSNDKFGAPNASVTAGSARIAANSGSLLTIGGNATVTAVGQGGVGTIPGTASTGSGTGGSAGIFSNTGGDVQIAGNATLNASGFAGTASGPGIDGGNGIGGNINVGADGAGSTITVGGTLTASADGIGGDGTGCTTCADDGGIGQGGQVFVNSRNGAATIDVTGGIQLSAQGFGGDSSSTLAGAGIGGMANFSASQGGTTIGRSTVTLGANGFGGTFATPSASGAAGTGGDASFGIFDGGTLSIQGAANAAASGIGGQSGASGGAGGNGNGGIAQVYHDRAGTIALNGGLALEASGTGGASSTIGGSGTGGQARAIFYNTLGGASSGGMTLAGSLVARAHGFGGANGGVGQGGTTRLAADTTGQTITISGDVLLKSTGFGGTGGTGRGGTAEIVATGTSDITANSVNVLASGTGGADVGAGAGAGFGGFAQLRVSGAGASINVNNVSADPDFFDRRILSADGFGGDTGFAGATAATGTGGTSTIDVNSGGVLNLPVLPATTNSLFLPTVWARGFGGFGTGNGTTAGNAIGGTANILVNGGTMTSGPTLLSAVGIGGSYSSVDALNVNGGNASGGSRNVSVTNGGTLSIGLFGGVSGGAGGDGLGTGRGGDASGGSSSLLIDNATLNITSPTIITNQTAGGAGAIGGNATGGSTFAQVLNGGVVNVTASGGTQGDFLISANAFGGGSFTPGGTSGGNATGGNTTLVVNGGTITGTGDVRVTAIGQGGSDQVAQGGAGTGGNAVIQLTNANISAGTLSLDASGIGGAIGANTAGTGGTGTGGFAQLQALAGTNVLNASVGINIDAGGQGGDHFGTTGAAGNGIGGTGRLVVNGGTLTITSPETELEEDGTGGESQSTSLADGGDGTAGTAEVFANGGALVVNGDLNLESDGEGGYGRNGGDGTASQSLALLHAQNGSVRVTGTTNLSAQGEGGNAFAGGNGGTATGGAAIVNAQSNLAGGSTISLQAINVNADAFAGAGGNGVTSGAGGAGGAAQGGSAQLFGDAGNGVLNVAGDTFASAVGYGGGGGIGGTGATGGAGGTGGSGAGGSVIIGTRSGLDTPSNTGSASFAGITAAAVGSGGFGGDGGGGSVSGAGGDGGDAVGGSAVIQTRGVPTSISGTATLLADALGGDGGSGATFGAGGDALVGSVGGVGVYITNRFNRTERGSLVGGGSIVASVQALPGLSADAIDGASSVGDFPAQFQVINGSVDFGGISIFVDGTQVTGTGPSDVTLTNATVNLAQNLHFVTPGNFTLALDNATLNVTDLLLDAGNFILPTAPALAGTVNVSGPLSITSGQDILTFANFNSQGDVGLFANGSIRVGDFSTTGALFFQALNGTVTTGNMQAGDDLLIDAALDVSTGSLTAGETVDIDGGGAVTTGALQAGDAVSITAVGALSVGNATAGIVNPSTSSAAEYNIGLRSLTSVTAGNLNALGSIGLAAPGAITVGNVATGSAGLGFLALGGTGVSTGSILTPAGGEVYIASYSMFALGDTGSDFDPTPILAAAPVAVAGPVTINGPISTGKVRINTLQNLSIAGATNAANFVSLTATGSLSAGAIQAVNAINTLSAGATSLGNLIAGTGLTVQSNGAIATGTLQAGTNVVAATNQSLTTGNAQAGGNVQLNAAGAIQTGTLAAGQMVNIGSNTAVATGAIDAGDRVAIQTPGALTLGNVTAGIVNPSTLTGAVYRIGLAGGSIAAGNLTARNGVLIGATNTLSTGNIVGSEALLLGGTGITTGAITAGTLNPSTGARALDGRVLLANSSMGALGGPFNNFDPNPVFAATPVAVAGPITIAGPVAAGNLSAVATGSIAANAFTTQFGTSLVSISGSTTATTIQSGDTVFVSGATGVTLGNVSAGIVNPSTNPAATYRIGIASGSGSVSTGSLTARRDVGVQAGQGIATGNIAGRDVLLLAGSSVATGSIQALNGTLPTGRVYIGNVSMATTTANVFSPFSSLSTLFNTNPVRVGGAITLGGAVNAGSLFAATAQGISLQAVTANLTSTGFLGFIDIDAVGLASINGRLAAGDRIDIASGDIDITSNGSLDALSLAGEIQLASNNPNGMFVGDGLSGNGYSLSNAEFARLKAGQIAIVGDDISGLTTDLTIGTLAITSSQLYGSGGAAVFATGNRATQAFSGLLRINGAITASGFDADTSLEFHTGTFELNAETGSVFVTGSGTALGGFLEIDADRIHVASDAILAKLRADPDYDGHVQELNAPAKVQRPGGVLGALSLDLEGDRTIFIQNTGSALVPAGFVTRLDSDTDIGGENDPPAGGTEIVINGQLQTDTGVLTGREAYDAAIAQAKADAMADGEPFAADLKTTSTLNGCGITTGTCSFTGADPVAAISSEIAIITQTSLATTPPNKTSDDGGDGDGVLEDAADEAVDDLEEGGEESGEDKKEEKDAEEAAAAPIAPPTPLINTRALDPAVRVVEPVAGAGNPALIGSAVNEATAQGDDQ
ncbi:MAG TPA: hypothetical protein VM055_06525 [Novosphingobium sp.]|nr:hypothetical protein [Novosphingobium sp.]